MRRRRTGEADGQRAFIATRHALHARAHLLDAGEQLHGVAMERGAGGGQRHAAWLAVEQGHAQLGLQRLQLLGERGLLDAQLLGGAGHGAGFGHGQEVTQVSQFHR
ncbi:hypothetical protein D3C87_1278150 [compost metagenome]